MALKLRNNFVNVDTYVVGDTEIPKGTYVKLSSSVLVAAGAGEDGEGITTEIGYAGKECRVAGPGSTCLALAHDNAITEGLYLVCSSTGRVDGAATMYSASQKIIGKAKMASSAAGQLISVFVMDIPVAKAAG